MLLNRSDPPGQVTGPIAVDEPLPALDGDTLSGTTVSTRAFAGHVTVVNVWATWCTPCLQEIPDLKRVADRYASQGVRFLGINYRDDRAAARRWQDDRFHLHYPSLFDPSGRFAGALNVPNLPGTFVVDPAGTIRWQIVGKTDQAELSGLLDQVLAQTRATALASHGQ